MLELLIAVGGFLIAVGLLTTVHEFGHFWVARRCGVKVQRFSIGFGRPLLTWHDKLGIEYVIAAIPLGGYVKMLDETEGDEVLPQEQNMAFNRKSVGVRIAVICAGPLANIFFAVFAYWLVFMIGVTTLVPILGAIPKGSIADLAKLQQGYEIVSINEQPTASWEDVSVALMTHLGGKDFVKLQALDRASNNYSEHVLDLTHWSIDNKEGDILKSLGMAPYDPVPPIVGKLMLGYPAEQAGLLPGDEIIRADEQLISTRTQLTRYLRLKPNQEVTLEVKRADQTKKEFTLKPVKKLIEGGEEVGFIGIQYQQTQLPTNFVRSVSYGPLVAFGKALVKTKDYTLLTVQFLQKIFTGKMSLSHIAGPISIAKYAGETVRYGIEYFLGFLALVSISLGVLNMLPIPILDGGHFVFCIVELLIGRPISGRILELGRYFGVAFLVCLMILALHNDIVRL